MKEINHYVIESWAGENGEVLESGTYYSFQSALDAYDNEWSDCKYRRLLSEDQDGNMIEVLASTW